MRASILVILMVGAAAFTGAAQADVSIGDNHTKNMDCNAGACTATAKKAVLNAGDLETMLASGNVTVKTGNLANSIEIDQPLTWANASNLTLDAQQSVVLNKAVTVTGTGALTVITNDNGGRKKYGKFAVVLQHGSVQFWDLASKLTIDGQPYALVGDIKTLDSDIAANPSGFYALAKPYDASADGTYQQTPIRGEFKGTFEGLGNVIGGLRVNQRSSLLTGLFGYIASGGELRDLGLMYVNVANTSPNAHHEDKTGALAGINFGTIHNCYADGFVRARVYDVGGLVGDNENRIDGSWTNVAVKGGFAAGGLAGFNVGTISDSYAAGTVSGSEEFDGGLVGWNSKATVENSYSTSLISGTGALGGVIGYDESGEGNLSADYWDLDTSGVRDPAQGSGNVPNEPGLLGLSDAQLKSGLPDGFDPNIWGRNPNINNGYPFLLINPPPR